MASKRLGQKRRLFERRKARVRRHISGTADRPRLRITRSGRHIYAQVIDDTAGNTLAASSSLALKLVGANVATANAVGKSVAEKAIAAGVKQVVFDRGGNLYHGRVKALADGAREAGLDF